MELKVKIQYGDLDLVASGIVHVFSDKPTKLTLYDDDDDPLDIILTFVNDRYKKSDYIDKPIAGKNAFEIICTNFNSPFGHRLNEPWLIGASFNRELFLVFEISGDDHGNNKIIQYSFFVGKEVKG